VDRPPRACLERQFGAAVTPGPWPTDPASAARWLAIVVHDIDGRSYEGREVLLAGFLKAAWPSHTGQSQ
jgi:hypothetical protein